MELHLSETMKQELTQTFLIVQTDLHLTVNSDCTLVLNPHLSYIEYCN